jgi:hypothetical protein
MDTFYGWICLCVAVSAAFGLTEMISEIVYRDTKKTSKTLRITRKF